MRHHKYTKPGDHHLMFADLINTVVFVLSTPCEIGLQWSASAHCMSQLFGDPIEYRHAAYPMWELEEQGAGSHELTLIFPVRKGTAYVRFIYTGDRYVLLSIDFQSMPKAPEPRYRGCVVWGAP